MTVAAFIILGPLLAVAACLVIRRGVGAIALLGAVVSLLAAAITLGRVNDGERLAATLPGLPGLPLRLVVDPLAASLATTVAVVATLVLLYAVGYMEGESDRTRFFAGMAFFVAAMQTLVLAGDWLLFLAAWELIGLASYLLIGFWYERPGVGGAATRAFVTTRAADAGLYVGVFALVTASGTTAIAATLDAGGTVAAVAGLGFLLAAAGKSAQTPLQGWLQEAMAGPTPVSALLHSATLVVAGVVLLTRALPLLPDEVRLLVGLLGGATALVTGLIAIAERDLKRMLAASTSSQLGLMLLALGAGSSGAAVVHLVAHAAMKSALFLGAGIFQHDREATGFQELAGVGRDRRWVYAGVAVAGLALASVPPLAGFWSKDAVIAAALAGDWPWVLAPLAILGSLLTGVYVGRALRLLWRGAGAADVVGEHGGRIPLMGTALAALVLLAMTLGLAVRPIEHVIEREVPEATAALVAGLVAAALGLAAGWVVPAGRLLGPLLDPARRGFRLSGGFGGFAVGPVMTLARASDRLDRRLHGAALGGGRSALDVAGVLGAADVGLHRLVTGVGAGAMGFAVATREGAEAAIDGAIAALVRATRRLGGRARRLQTGLVHRELLVAAGGAAVIVLLVLVL